MAVKIAFIGAGSTIFMKNIVGDALRRPALRDAHVALMDVDRKRLAESELVARKLAATLGAPATITAHLDRAAALAGADFVIVAFQIGGYRPATVTDFEIPRRFGLRQTIADTLGVGGVMRALRTVPELWAVCADMERLCPDALLLQYVNPMAINTWAIAERFPRIRQAGLCHSVQHTAWELAHDLDLPVERLSYDVAGINHMAFFLRLEERLEGGGRADLAPRLRAARAAGTVPKPNRTHHRCPNLVRYEMFDRLGFFVTESSEHFAEYVPWFIKRDRPDLIERYGIPLDEYPSRCEEQIAAWEAEAKALGAAERIETEPSDEYAAAIMEAEITDRPVKVHVNLPNRGQIPQLPLGAAVETPCIADAGGIRPALVENIPPQLIALMRTSINVQELTVAALMNESREHVHHAVMMDPHAAAELDLGQLHDMTEALIAAHGDLMPQWLRAA